MTGRKVLLKVQRISDFQVELTGCTNGEQHLHGVEEEEHHEQRDRRAQWQAQRVGGVERREARIYAEKIF